jgi:endonuclease/exonuclease/phosphatase family metal-dependent hydrolase
VKPAELSAQTLNVVSWNLKDFGQSRDDDAIRMIAEVIKDADIVAIQEVVGKDPRGAQAVARLADELNRMGTKWGYIVSNPTVSPSPYISERYAYLWKTAKVSINRDHARLISELADQVDREPYLIHFKTKNQDLLTMINYHACTHNKYFPERAEISAISSWLIDQNFKNVIWAGDMNLVIEDRAFNAIRSAGYSSALKGEKTTLKTKCDNGNYLSRAEDNVFYKLHNFQSQGATILDFIEDGDCGDVEWKRVSYSDHLGVRFVIGRVDRS